MALKDEYGRMPLASLNINRAGRQRREINVKDLLGSIRRNGVIEPVIVEYNPDLDLFDLIAGERRVEASRQLGLFDVPYRLASELSPIEREIIELEENVKREDLGWRDHVGALARIHELYCQQAGETGWTQAATCAELNIAENMLSQALKVWESFDDEYVAKAGGFREAYNLLLRRDQRAAGNAIAELIGGETGDDPTPAELSAMEAQRVADIQPGDALTQSEFGSGVRVQLPSGETINRDWTTSIGDSQPSLPIPDLEPIRQADFVEWIASYAGRKYNLIHCDFPYGVGLFSSNGIRTGEARSQMGAADGETYDDSPETYRTLVEALAGNLDRIMSISGHIMFWYSNKVEIERWTRETFARLAPSISWTRFPLVWLKSDNAGIAASPNYEPRHIYETCLLGSRGKRQIVKIVSDAYSAPTDKSIHASAKPEPMLRHFMTMLVDAETSVFDPTCGSGTALRAAESLGAKVVLGLERDGRMVELALRALKTERAKRRLAREF